MVNIAIFASGTGTNAERLISYFKESDKARVKLLVCNNPNAGAVEVANKYGVEVLMVNNADLEAKNSLLIQLKEKSIHFIVLAGFLRKIPPELIQNYEGRMINIHPALLPKFGGKGMYGKRVHEAVIAAGEKESGITIHHVTEHYDEGGIIFQAKCAIAENETAESLQHKIHELEHAHFPIVTAQQIELCQN